MGNFRLAIQQLVTENAKDRAKAALEFARQGDWHAIADYLRRNNGEKRLPPDMEAFIADVMDGKLRGKRPRQFRRQKVLRAQGARVLWYLKMAPAVGRKKALDAQERGLGEMNYSNRRTIERDLAEHGGEVRAMLSMIDNLEAYLKQRYGAGPPYSISSTALKPYSGAPGP